jgi:hypothetical protein
MKPHESWRLERSYFWAPERPLGLMAAVGAALVAALMARLKLTVIQMVTLSPKRERVKSLMRKTMDSNASSVTNCSLTFSRKFHSTSY